MARVCQARTTPADDERRNGFVRGFVVVGGAAGQVGAGARVQVPRVRAGRFAWGGEVRAARVGRRVQRRPQRIPCATAQATASARVDAPILR